jgi:hypothetical protein
MVAAPGIGGVPGGAVAVGVTVVPRGAARGGTVVIGGTEPFDEHPVAVPIAIATAAAAASAPFADRRGAGTRTGTEAT